MRSPLHTLFAITTLCTLSCASPEQTRVAGKDGGTLVIATAGDADNLLPPLTVSFTSSEVGALIFERLAEPGMDLNTIGDVGFEPRLARSWKWAPDSMSITFSLDPKAHWQDGKPVTARDVAFTYSVYTDSVVGSAVAPLIPDIDSVSMRDSLTPVFWFKKRTPEQFLQATFQMRILPEHLLGSIKRSELGTSTFAREPIGTGPYRLVKWTPGSALELVADTTYYRGRPHIDRIIFSVAPDPQTMVLRLWSGDADVLEYLRPIDVADMPKHPTLKTLRLPRMEYSHIILNQRDPHALKNPHPIFADRDVRRALGMAVDRRRIIRSLFDDTLGYVAVGPVTHAMATYDSTIPQLPYDPDSAAKLLEARGWHMGPNGIRQKGGKPLRFSIIVPTSSTLRAQATVLVQDMFKKVGADMQVEQLDFPTHIRRSQAHQFDASFITTALDPTPSTIRQGWSAAAARRNDGSNYGLYESQAFDAVVDSAATERDVAKATALYRRAYAMLVADAPTIFIYEPKTVMALHRRVQPERVRVDAWFTNLAEWWIAPGERIARDQAGLADRPR